MLETAADIYEQPVDLEMIAERKAQYHGPYRAMSAYKGDEVTGSYDYPWIVVGVANVNCFGRLWSKQYAESVAAEMNK